MSDLVCQVIDQFDGFFPVHPVCRASAVVAAVPKDRLVGVGEGRPVACRQSHAVWCAEGCVAPPAPNASSQHASVSATEHKSGRFVAETGHPSVSGENTRLKASLIYVPFSRVLGTFILGRQFGTSWAGVTIGNRPGNVLHRQ